MGQIRLNAKAYTHNIAQIAAKAGGIKRVILILKDNAYSHGLSLIAPKARQLGIDFVAVKNETEARQIAGLFSQILILSHLINGKENAQFIYAINELNALSKIAANSRIHLAFDTLMHRNGLALNELERAFEIIKERNLRLEGVYTHFRSSDEISCEYFIQRQIFNQIKQEVLKICDVLAMPKPIFHSKNSAATERFKTSDDELVRVGIAQFGYSTFDESLNLTPVLSLWANRLSARVLKKGQKIGYNGAYTASNDMAVATYDLGYGDGLLRYNGKGELRLANGEKMLGKMSMDSFSSADVGEWVCVFADVREWAKFFNTIEYDVLTKLNPLIPRVWV